MLRKVTVIAAALALLGGTALAAKHAAEPMDVHWKFEGPFGTFDQAQLQRGYKVYEEVCSQCHSLNLVTYGMLAQKGGPFWDDKYPNPNENPRAKALAADKQVPDIDTDTGDAIKRKATVADHMPNPFANEYAARASNGGSLPPDLSVIVKAREGGAAYVYSILNGYNMVPAGMKLDKLAMPTGKHFNRYMPGDVSSFWKGDHKDMPPGGLIAMPPPLTPNKVTFDDNTKSTVPQQAKDVAAFLAWASDPKATERKQTGFFVMIYLAVLALLAYASYRRVWRNESH
jgi:ubiquinol-cytochrome c reductase cytochrome c1 subunit